MINNCRAELMRKSLMVVVAILIGSVLWAQSVVTAKNNSRQTDTSSPIEMPYNRLIHSAGKIISYGNPELENHALDAVVLPDKKYVAIEDRFGIALLDAKTNEVATRWTFADSTSYKDLVSTYSGMTSFLYQQSTYIAWGAQGNGKDRGFVVIAEVRSDSITHLSFLRFTANAPARVTIPNQCQFNIENNIPYLYVALNGNNQLVKINFLNQGIIWTANTGEAPFGIRIVKDKIYVTNWAGPVTTDTTKERAGIPWGNVYTNPITGGTGQGSVSVIDMSNGATTNELSAGLHPNAIISSPDQQFLYVACANSDYISVIDLAKQTTVDSIAVGLFSRQNSYYGSSPDGLSISADGTSLFVVNGLDNAVAVVHLGSRVSSKGKGKTLVQGYIPTEAYPSGVALLNNHLYITNLEAKGARVLSKAGAFKQSGDRQIQAYSIHKELTSVSVIPVPTSAQLALYTRKVKRLNLSYRLVALLNQIPRKSALPKPVPERIGEPSLFKHVVYIIKENKTYDQVYGDIKEGNGDSTLCVYGRQITPNQHELSHRFSLLDNYYASGKSSAEGHQWTDAAMVSDYVEKNVRAWFRSYPHRQEDALVYNKAGFIWNDALDHGKKVRIFGEACKTNYDEKMNWFDIYNKYIKRDSLFLKNTTTIARIRPVIHPDYPDCDNLVFTDQLRADAFINEWHKYETEPGNSLPDLMILSLPDDHTAGTTPEFPTPRAMVADNDQALGRIIQTIMGSRFWDSTVVFVTEDDSQSGWDHVSSYRTTGLVISPYSGLQKTIHTKYNQTCIVRTIEQILGIPAMNIIDATALPMFDCFTNKKTDGAFWALESNIPLNERNKPFAALKGKALYYAKLSKNSSFKDLDSGDDDNMNRILWFDAKGNAPYPAFK